MPNTNLSYNDAMDFLLGAIDYEKISKYKYDADSFNLDRMLKLMEIVGNPHLDLNTIHVAGTKGKGSTSNMIAALLSGMGLKVGLFTSPHLINLGERLKVNGKEISSEALCEIIEVVRPYVEEERKKDLYLSPTFFETLTAIALLFFKREGVDIAVMEVGLGGRLDSTNIITPFVSVITSIGFDHMDKLGETIEEIAAEKAGIIKDGVPVVSDAQKDDALRVIEDVCAKKGSRLVLAGREITAKNGRPVKNAAELSGGKAAFGSLCDISTPNNQYNDLFIPAPGAHQITNCACAIAAVEIAASNLPEHKTTLSGAKGVDTVKQALKQLKCPGRIEPIAHDPLIIVDTAHTLESIQALKATLKDYMPPTKITLLFGISQDKEIDGLLNELIPFVDSAIYTTTDNPRSADPDDLAARHKRFGFKAECRAVHDIKEALETAIQITDKTSAVCVTGSTYLAGKVKELRMGGVGQA